MFVQYGVDVGNVFVDDIELVIVIQLVSSKLEMEVEQFFFGFMKFCFEVGIVEFMQFSGRSFECYQNCFFLVMIWVLIGSLCWVWCRVL